MDKWQLRNYIYAQVNDLSIVGKGRGGGGQDAGWLQMVKIAGKSDQDFRWFHKQMNIDFREQLSVWLHD